MKKIIPCILAFILVGGIITAVVIGTFKFMDSKTTKKDLSSYGEQYNNPTYEFTGKSSHYIFKIGRAVFNDESKSVLVTEIMQTKSIDFLKKQTLVVKFNDKEYKRLDCTSKLNSLRNPIEVLTVNIKQDKCSAEDEKECEEFEIEIPDKNDFKKNFELGVEYCTTEGKCTYEKFNIKYGKLF